MHRCPVVPMDLIAEVDEARHCSCLPWRSTLECCLPWLQSCSASRRYWPRPRRSSSRGAHCNPGAKPAQFLIPWLNRPRHCLPVCCGDPCDRLECLTSNVQQCRRCRGRLDCERVAARRRLKPHLGKKHAEPKAGPLSQTGQLPSICFKVSHSFSSDVHQSARYVCGCVSYAFYLSMARCAFQ